MDGASDRDDGQPSPLFREAERILAYRQHRLELIGQDLFGEPAWDILLCGYVAIRKGGGLLDRGCPSDNEAFARKYPPVVDFA